MVSKPRKTPFNCIMIQRKPNDYTYLAELNQSLNTHELKILATRYPRQPAPMHATMTLLLRVYCKLLISLMIVCCLIVMRASVSRINLRQAARSRHRRRDRHMLLAREFFGKMTKEFGID